VRALTRLALARPRTVLAAWWAGIGILALAGLGVQERLHRTGLDIPGTSSSQAAELAEEHFGETNGLVVLLEGPPRELERQSRRAARALRAEEGVRVLGPWSPGAGDALQPQRDQAVLLLRIDRPFEEASRELAPKLRSTLDKAVGGPVKAHLTGFPDIANGIHEGSIEALRHAELIAAPLLIVILLFVFRSVIAASLPLAVGMGTIGASTGVLDLLNRLDPLDAVALNLASMMGLALGVDYSLLLVSRFREEVASGNTAAGAAATAVNTAGRTVVFAGLALIGASVTAYLVAPGDVLASASAGVVVAVALSVIAALTGLPAALVIFGPKFDRWSLPGKRTEGSRFGGVALRALRRPALAAGVVMALVLALAMPAAGLQTGPPDPRLLPAKSPQRSDYDAVTEALGSGWAAPYQVTVSTKQGSITSPRRLAALERWQARQASRPGVAAVLGPAQLAERTGRLRRASDQLAGAERSLERGIRDQHRLEQGLGRASRGAEELHAGLQLASAGSEQLAEGGRTAGTGAALLAQGLRRARRGALDLRAGMRQARAGADALAAGAGRAFRGTVRLRRGLAEARGQTAEAIPRVQALARGLDQGAERLAALQSPAQTAARELERAVRLLDEMLPTSKADPRFGDLYQAVGTASGAVTGRHPLSGEPVAPGYDGLPSELGSASAEATRAAAGIRQLAGGLTRLEAGFGRLGAGASSLARGIERLEQGAATLLAGLDRLEAGGGALAQGLDELARGAARLTSGNEALAAGAVRLDDRLSSGASETTGLVDGLEQMEEGVVGARIRTERMSRSFERSDQLARSLDSGYFVLAAMETAEPVERAAAAFGVNVDRGGSAVQMLVVGKGDVNRAGHPLRSSLHNDAEGLAAQVGGTALVGGPATVLQDFDSSTFSRFWLLVAALCLVTYLLLVPILRSVVLPALAVALNVATVAAAFGVLVVLFNGDAPLGGPGWLDAIMVSGIFSVVFGLSIDYEVFLLARMREGYSLTGSTNGAIRYGVERTAGVVTGAALIMTGVFIAFATSDLASLRQFGIGLTVAVLLDATLIRLVLLPAAMRLCGEACWWLPEWLDRLLPQFNVEGAGEAATASLEQPAAGRGW